MKMNKFLFGLLHKAHPVTECEKNGAGISKEKYQWVHGSLTVE